MIDLTVFSSVGRWTVVGETIRLLYPSLAPIVSAPAHCWQSFQKSRTSFGLMTNVSGPPSNRLRLLKSFVKTALLYVVKVRDHALIRSALGINGLYKWRVQAHCPLLVHKCIRHLFEPTIPVIAIHLLRYGRRFAAGDWRWTRQSLWVWTDSQGVYYLRRVNNISFFFFNY